MITDSDRQYLKVGFKRVLKSVNAGAADRVYLAADCDDNIKKSVEEAVQRENAQLFYIKSMRELGSMCGINVGASCAAILSNH